MRLIKLVNQVGYITQCPVSFCFKNNPFLCINPLNVKTSADLPPPTLTTVNYGKRLKN